MILTEIAEWIFGIVSNKINGQFNTAYTGYQCNNKFQNLVRDHNVSNSDKVDDPQVKKGWLSNGIFCREPLDDLVDSKRIPGAYCWGKLYTSRKSKGKAGGTTKTLIVS